MDLHIVRGVLFDFLASESMDFFKDIARFFNDIVFLLLFMD